MTIEYFFKSEEMRFTANIIKKPQKLLLQGDNNYDFLSNNIDNKNPIGIVISNTIF